MPNKRTILDAMRVDELTAAAASFDLEVGSSRRKGELIDTIAKSRRVRPDELLSSLTKASLQRVAKKLDLDQRGSKTALVERIAPPREERTSAKSQGKASRSKPNGKSKTVGQKKTRKKNVNDNSPVLKKRSKRRLTLPQLERHLFGTCQRF